MSNRLSEEQKAVLHEIIQPGEHLLKISAISGSGKAQPYSEKVLTPDGWNTMKNIKKNDYVIGSDGKRKQVLNIYEQGIREVYKVKFIDGTEVLCDKEHLWTVYENNKLITKTVSEILQKTISTKYFDKRYNTFQNKYRYAIPLSKEIEYSTSSNELLLNPYYLGLLIGDGGFTSNRIRFTNSNLNIIEKLKNTLPENDKIEYSSKYDYVISSKKKWKKSSTKLALIKYNLDGKKSTEKHIPKEYLYADIESRKLLLQGLIDSDGYLVNGKLDEYSTSSKQLANDFIELSRGLGHIATLHERDTHYTYNGEKKEGKKNYRIRFLNKTKKSIISIEYSHNELCKCIEVDSKDHLYVTNGFNLTHNTHLLRAIADIVKPKNGLYLAYNKQIADESSEKFNKNHITCMTIHSFAYGYIVKPLKYQVAGSDLTGRIFKDISVLEFPEEVRNDKKTLDMHMHYIKHLEYPRKDLIAVTINKFLLSKYYKYVDFIQNEFLDILEPEEIMFGSLYLAAMKNNKVKITHSFYLKMFQIMLKMGKIKSLPEFDLIMLDEAGDVNPVSLEIFKLIKCNKKIIVGDTEQNIYSFNNTINGFKELEDVGKKFELSQSFRVCEEISKEVELFSKMFLKPNMTFSGRKYLFNEIPKREDQTVAYIARTNSALVDKMIDCYMTNTPFNTTRSVESIFRMHRALIFVKPDGEIRDPDLEFIQHDCDEWSNDIDLQNKFPSFFGYMLYKNENNVGLTSAIKCIMKYKSKLILDIYKKAKAHEEDRRKHKITLTTAHASKG